VSEHTETIKDLFADGAEVPVDLPVKHTVPPSESVYVDIGVDELFYVGEIQLPRPTPVELVVEIDGWDYVYKLDRRSKA
jgi:hypothetical protein